MEYNCDKCEEYWRKILHYWSDLGEDVEFIKLYCPACKRVKELEW